jgi:methyl-accepting chemotaxis protein
MIKFNRIGYKLGLAGAVGMLLSIGMVTNQMVAESSVDAANQLADRQQGVADHTLATDITLRRMQIGLRDVRLARTPAEIDKGADLFRKTMVQQQKEIEAALVLVMKPESRERLQKIKSLMSDYFASGEDMIKAQSNLLALVDKRTAISGEWNKAFEATLATPSLAELANHQDIEKLLYQSDTKINGLRAAIWRFGATGDDTQKKVIADDVSALQALMLRIRGLDDDKAFEDGIDGLIAVVKRYIAANDETVKAEDLKTDIVVNRTLKIVNEVGELITTANSTAAKASVETKAAATNELAQANRIGFFLAVVVMASMVVSIVFSFLGISRPLTRLNGALGKMAAGELDIEIPGADRGDEVGDIAKTVVVIRKNAEQKARVEAEAKADQDQIAAKRRKADMIKLADDFESAVGEIVETVSSASTELEASATTLTATAERAQELTTAVAAASEEASTNVQSVASATEEMASSVNEISRQVQESARMAGEAVDQARKTNDRVSELSKAASRIGDVVELINTIAGQTNLLALNATIEAARAGEAGRGFAVVASEVKALAEQTAKATGEIGQQITGIQAATQESVGAIREISGTIERLSEISSTIAAAVEEQGAATQEISRNVQQAAQGTQQVSSNITDVQRGASETGSASSQVLSAAQLLSGDSNRLKLEVGKFLNSVRAA